MWAVACMLGLVYMGSVLPTPLYVAYRRRFHFSEIALTLIYTAYVVGTLTALIFFGRLSDQIGRRRAALPAIAVAALSTFVFIFTIDTGMLFAGRILSGFATGIVAGTATAWIVELHPKRIHADPTVIAVAFNLAGLALGPLMTGLLAQYAPLPLRLTYVAYLPFLIAAAVIVFNAPETVQDTKSQLTEVSLKPRIGVPAGIRAQFVPPAATAFGTFALFGFYSALTPGLLNTELHETNRAFAGVVVFELALIATVTLAVTKSLKSRPAMLSGMGLLLPGIALLELAREARSMPLLLGATALCGVSVALGYRGSLEAINRIAPGEQRAEVLSAYFVVCYIGLSLPVIGIGVISETANPEIANLTFAAVVALFAAGTLVTGIKYAPKS